MTKAEMAAKLVAMGLKREYKPVWDPESERMGLEVRRPPRFVDGRMSGAEVDLYDTRTIRVWTSKKKKARQIALDNGFKVRLLDGEAELYLPGDRADEFLHQLGAKVRSKRKPPSPETIAKGQAALKRMREARKAKLGPSNATLGTDS